MSLMNERKQPVTYHLQLLLMVVILVATLALGFYLMPRTDAEREQLLGELGTTNHGKLLLPPRSIAELQLEDSEGNPWSRSGPSPKWQLLIVAGERCGEPCQQLLYTTRQVHILLGKHTSRLQRIYLGMAGPLEPAALETLKKSHPYLQPAYADRGVFDDWLVALNSHLAVSSGLALLVDPRGDAMMAYTANHSGNEILEDLNHLFKYSAD